MKRPLKHNYENGSLLGYVQAVYINGNQKHSEVNISVAPPSTAPLLLPTVALLTFVRVYSGQAN